MPMEKNRNKIEQKNRGEHEKSDVKHMEISCANPSDMFDSIKTKSHSTSSQQSPSLSFGWQLETMHSQYLAECIRIHRFEFITIRCTMSNEGHNYLTLRRMPSRQRNLSSQQRRQWVPLTLSPHFFSISFLYLSPWVFFCVEHRDSDRQVTVSMARSSAHSALSIRHRDKLTDEKWINERKKEKSKRSRKEETVVASMQNVILMSRCRFATEPCAMPSRNSSLCRRDYPVANFTVRSLSFDFRLFNLLHFGCHFASNFTFICELQIILLSIGLIAVRAHWNRRRRLPPIRSGPAPMQRRRS